MLYTVRNKVIEFFDDYSSMVSEVKLKATKGTALKILTLILVGFLEVCFVVREGKIVPPCLKLVRIMLEV